MSYWYLLETCTREYKVESIERTSNQSASLSVYHPVYPVGKHG